MYCNKYAMIIGCPVSYKKNHYCRSSSICARIFHSNHERWIVTRIVTFSHGSVPRSIPACCHQLPFSQSNRIQQIESKCVVLWLLRSLSVRPSAYCDSFHVPDITTKKENNAGIPPWAQNKHVEYKSKSGKMGSTKKSRTIRRIIVAAANSTLFKARSNGRQQILILRYEFVRFQFVILSFVDLIP